MERVDKIFRILDTSTLCKGVQVKDGEVLDSVIPHQSGLYNDGPIEEKRVFFRQVLPTLQYRQAVL